MIKGNNLKILDIGCATCNFENFFLIKNKNKKFKFYCIDTDADLIRIAKKKQFDERIVIQKKSITNFKNKISFDYILILSTINLWKEPFKIINKIKQKLNKHGKIIIFDAFNTNNLNTIIKTVSTKEKGRFVNSYFFDRNYFMKKVESKGKFGCKFIPMKFKSFKKKKKTIWNESYTVKLNENIKYLRSDNYLLDQFVVEIKKLN